MVRILFEDADLCVVHKPAGLVVHRRARGSDRREPALLQAVRDTLHQRVYPVHRLDRATSGLVVFARCPEMAGRLSQQFRERTVGKQYQALVRGFLLSPRTVIAGLKKHSPGGAPQTDTAGRLAAQTELVPTNWFEIPEPSDRYATTRCTCLTARPRTGRWHQIRRHLNHVSHPVIGDTAHGDHRRNRFFRDRLGADRLMLAAVRLQFRHPRTAVPLEIHCEPAEEFQRVIRRLARWRVTPCGVHRAALPR